MIKNKPLIYIAAPYILGNIMHNIRTAINAFDEIIAKNAIPYIPHVSGFLDLICPHPSEFWLDYDLYWLNVCNALLRLPGKSNGADREIQFMLDKGKPVFYNYDELEKYIKNWNDGEVKNE